MTIRLTKTQLAVVAIVVVALFLPATAVATHVFSDVPDDRFYADPVEWAAANLITTGTGPTTFEPDRNVTRGESVTFLKRYDDNIVQPALTAIRTDLAGSTIGLFASDTSNSAVSTTSSTPVDSGLSATVTIPEGHTGVIQIIFTAESACYGSAGFCVLEISLNGDLLSEAFGGFAFNSTDGDTEGSGSWESLATMEITDSLSAGTYEVTVAHWTGSTTTSWLDELRLSAQVHLDS